MDYIAKIHSIKKEISHNIGRANKAKKAKHSLMVSGEKREIGEISHSGSDITVDLAAKLTSVYWQSQDRILGPAAVSFVAKHQGQFFLCLEWQKGFLWIHESLLRSKRDFEAQGQVLCNCCGGSEYWRSEFVEAICRRCHPPASESKGEHHAS